MEVQHETILVTGAAGFIGSHLVDALLRHNGTRIRALDNLATGSRDNIQHLLDRQAIEFIVGDVGERDLVARLLDGVDIVFHLACRGVRHSLGEPLANHHTNATATLELLREAHKAGVRRFVHVSSSEVYGTAQYAPMDEQHPCHPETVYGAAKLAGEAYARAYYRTYGLPTVVVRPFNNFGPRSHFEGDAGEVIPRFVARALCGEPPIIYGDGSQTRDFLYVEDTAYWLCEAARCDELVGRTVNLASGTETSVRELADIVCREVGRPGMSPIFHSPRPGDVRRHIGSAAKAAALLGFRPRTSLRDGIRKLIAHLRLHSQQGGLLDQVPETNWKLAS